MRLVLPSAFALLACAAACTTFGSEPAEAGADAGSSGTSGSGTSGAEPPDEVDAAPPTPTATIPCGALVCANGQSCCITSKEASCTSGRCTGIVVTCAEQNDCAKGTLCCAHVDPRTTTSVSCVRAEICIRSFYTSVCESPSDCKGKACNPVENAGGVKACDL